MTTADTWPPPAVKHDRPRVLAIVLAYYENAGMLARQFEAIAALPVGLACMLRLIVVDDGSPAHPAEFPARPPCEALLLRMAEDIPWNQDACRNLGVTQAGNGRGHPDSQWILLTDMDHIPSEDLLRHAVEADLDPRCAYRPARVTAPGMDPYKPHPNSWLMTQALYMDAGGYDERYRGIYGTDGMFASRIERQCARVGGAVVDLAETLIRHPREYVPDASTVGLTRKSPENDERRRLLGREIKASGDTAPKWGLTKWSRLR